MEPSFATFLINWLSDHPTYTSLIIFFIAMTESLAVVGLLMPGVVFMFAIGAYVATGHYSFINACIWAFAGAVVGDGISYYLGRRYQNRLLNSWPLSRYPDSVQKAIVFFKRHGNKSVLIGRFIGPLRPLIPAIAGSFHMTGGQFFISNILSALLWAPIILLPGYVFGLSFEVASAVLGRLLLVVLLFISITMLILWLTKKIYLFFLPRTKYFIQRLLDWSQQHPLVGKLPGSLLEAKQSDYRALLVLCLLFFLLFLLLFILPAQLILSAPSENIDLFIQNSVTYLRSPNTDQLIQWILDLYQLSWLIILCVLIAVVLIWKRNIQLLRYACLALLLPYILQQYYPQSIFAVCVYALLSMIFVLGQSNKLRRIVYGASLLLISSVLIAEIFSGRVALLAACLAIIFSLLWISVLALAYRHHAENFRLSSPQQLSLSSGFIILLLLQYSYYPQKTFDYSQKQSINTVIAELTWIESVWQVLPHFRQDFLNQQNQPFNLQWADTIKNIHRTLIASGWNQSDSPQAVTLLQWFKPSAQITDLPIMPHLHQGQYESLRYVRIDAKLQKINVIRLWPSHFIIQYNKYKNEIRVPLWIGSFSSLVLAEQFGLRYLTTQLEYSSAFKNNIVLNQLQPNNKKLEKWISKYQKNNIHLLSSFNRHSNQKPRTGSTQEHK